MKSRGWQVCLIRYPAKGDYPKEFFPRNMYYKRDALYLAEEVRILGGLAYVCKNTTLAAAMNPIKKPNKG